MGYFEYAVRHVPYSIIADFMQNPFFQEVWGHYRYVVTVDKSLSVRKNMLGSVDNSTMLAEKPRFSALRCSFTSM